MPRCVFGASRHRQNGGRIPNKTRLSDRYPTTPIAHTTSGDRQATGGIEGATTAERQLSERAEAEAARNFISTVNSQSSVEAINSAIKARTPRGRAKRLAEINHQLDQIKGEMLAVTRSLSQLQAAVRANANTPAKAATKDDRPFYLRSEAHRAAWERFHKKKAPSK